MARILAIGGAHVDRRGQIFGDTAPGASNPGAWREEAGGGVFNAASWLARLGNSVRLIAPRGGDAAGEMVAETAAAAGIEDTPLTFLDRATPSYTAILEADGNLVIALADMALYDVYGPRQIARRGVRDAIAASDAILTDANLPAPTLAALAKTCAAAAKPLFAIAISPAKVVRLAPLLGGFTAVFMNEAEARALAGDAPDGAASWPALLRAAGLNAAVISRGGAPVVAYDGANAWLAEPPQVRTIVDVTGAGDALAAATIAARLTGASLPDALRLGLAAAAVAISSEQAVPEGVDAALLEELLPLVPEPSPAA